MVTESQADEIARVETRLRWSVPSPDLCALGHTSPQLQKMIGRQLGRPTSVHTPHPGPVQPPGIHAYYGAPPAPFPQPRARLAPGPDPAHEIPRRHPPLRNPARARRRAPRRQEPRPRPLRLRPRRVRRHHPPLPPPPARPGEGVRRPAGHDPRRPRRVHLGREGRRDGDGPPGARAPHPHRPRHHAAARRGRRCRGQRLRRQHRHPSARLPPHRPRPAHGARLRARRRPLRLLALEVLPAAQLRPGCARRRGRPRPPRLRPPPRL